MEAIQRLATQLSLKRRMCQNSQCTGHALGVGPYHAAAIFPKKECAQRASLW